MSLLCVANSTAFKAKALLQILQESRGRNTHHPPAVVKFIKMMSHKFGSSEVDPQGFCESPMEVDTQQCDITGETSGKHKYDALTSETKEKDVSEEKPDLDGAKMEVDPDKTATGLVPDTKPKFETLSSLNSRLYFDIQRQQWPIVYSDKYNIRFWGLQNLHPFDAGKWGRIFEFLKDEKMLHEEIIVEPKEATQEDLRVVHSDKYINSLKRSMVVAGITEVPPVAFLPNSMVQSRVLTPFRFQTGGTILAGKLAVERGWAINIGGGFHHCSAQKGGGFCAYADITLCIKFLFERMPSKVSKVMIVDLDAHQGNGHERDFKGDERVYIMDVYNRGIYPFDGFAKGAIRKKVELPHRTKDEEYLRKVSENLKEALQEFDPHLIVYNAGTDILDGDQLGNLCVSSEGIIRRDEIVFQEARSRKIPIVMTTSGGYTKATARIIADSIQNLRAKKLIECKEAELAAKDYFVHGTVMKRSASGSKTSLSGWLPWNWGRNLDTQPAFPPSSPDKGNNDPFSSPHKRHENE